LGEQIANLIHPGEWGDAYIWTAINSETKMVLLHLTAKRDSARAYDFIRDLSERVTRRFQITTDGLRGYVPTIEEYFGADVDFAQLLKPYGSTYGEGPDWYKSSQVTATIPIPINGNPNPRYISTSPVERANLSVRTHLRGFTRLSLGLSKSLSHLRASVHLYMAFFNFCRVHHTLRVAPGMQAGIADHTWNVGELICSIY
jgi:IS1 family transposase